MATTLVYLTATGCSARLYYTNPTTGKWVHESCSNGTTWASVRSNSGDKVMVSNVSANSGYTTPITFGYNLPNGNTGSETLSGNTRTISDLSYTRRLTVTATKGASYSGMITVSDYYHAGSTTYPTRGYAKVKVSSLSAGAGSWSIYAKTTASSDYWVKATSVGNGTYTIECDNLYDSQTSQRYYFQLRDPNGTARSTAQLAHQTKPTQYNYYLHFNANQGTGGPSTQTYSDFGSGDIHYFTIPSTTPTRSGYTFSSWNTSSLGNGTNYQPGGRIGVYPNEDTTLYAKWAGQTTWTVNYNCNGGTYNNQTTYVWSTTNYQTSYTPTCLYITPVRSGYKFLGWGSRYDTRATYTGGDSLMTLTTATPSRTIYAIWEKLPTYNFWLYYDANGGSGEPNTQSASSTTDAPYTFIVSSTTPTRTNYQFSSWNTQEDGSGTTYRGGDYISVPQNEYITLYARWIGQTTYTLTYNMNGGTYNNRTTYSQTNTSYSTSWTPTILSITPIRDGYRFLGWSSTSTATKANWTAGDSYYTLYSTNPSATIYAVWEKLPTYNYWLSYRGNAGSDTVNNLPDIQHSTTTSGIDYTFYISTNTPTRSGYQFKYYTVNTPNDSGTKYYPGDTIKVPPEETYYLYCQWSKLYTYTLKYSANGGSGAPSSDTYGPTADTAHWFTISSTKPTRNYSTFLGWSYDSSATTPTFQAGDAAVLQSDNPTRTLYAVWSNSRYFTWLGSDSSDNNYIKAGMVFRLYMLANKWNQLNSLIKQYVNSNYTYTTVDSGTRMTAAIMMQPVNALGLNYNFSKGMTIKASYFIELKNALNDKLK